MTEAENALTETVCTVNICVFQHVSGASGHTSGSSPRLPFDLCPSSDAAAVLPPDSVSQGPDACSSSSSSAFNETLRLALDRIKVLEVANKELEERIKTQERMILELVERNHLLSRCVTHNLHCCFIFKPNCF